MIISCAKSLIWLRMLRISSLSDLSFYPPVNSEKANHQNIAHTSVESTMTAANPAITLSASRFEVSPKSRIPRMIAEVLLRSGLGRRCSRDLGLDMRRLNKCIRVRQGWGCRSLPPSYEGVFVLSVDEPGVVIPVVALAMASQRACTF